jgi:hypothetical protein
MPQRVERRFKGPWDWGVERNVLDEKVKQEDKLRAGFYEG